MALRVALFIDHHNVYRGAFFDPSSRSVDGQFDPRAVGQLVCERGPPDEERVLHQVRVYTGQPDSTKQPKAYGAHMRQIGAWRTANSGATT